MRESHQIKHIAIIPDGNRRWAKKHGLISIQGHKYAADTVLPALYDVIAEYNIPYCTFWALSPENFKKRSSFEINSLINILEVFLRTKINELNKKNIKILVIGDLKSLSQKVQKEIEEGIEKTANNTGMILTFAINYGGRDEIVRAVNKWRIDKSNENKTLTKIDFQKYLDTSGVPDPDLIIRTGGEKRTSGFMLWQSEYAEYMFLDTLFPDFTKEAFRKCISDFESRNRRYGK